MIVAGLGADREPVAADRRAHGPAGRPERAGEAGLELAGGPAAAVVVVHVAVVALLAGRGVDDAVAARGEVQSPLQVGSRAAGVALLAGGVLVIAVAAAAQRAVRVAARRVLHVACRRSSHCSPRGGVDEAVAAGGARCSRCRRCRRLRRRRRTASPAADVDDAVAAEARPCSWRCTSSVSTPVSPSVALLAAVDGAVAAGSADLQSAEQSSPLDGVAVVALLARDRCRRSRCRSSRPTCSRRSSRRRRVLLPSSQTSPCGVDDAVAAGLVRLAVAEQPSPLMVLPSSHASPASRRRRRCRRPRSSLQSPSSRRRRRCCRRRRPRPAVSTMPLPQLSLRLAVGASSRRPTLLPSSQTSPAAVSTMPLPQISFDLQSARAAVAVDDVAVVARPRPRRVDDAVAAVSLMHTSCIAIRTC